MIKVETQPTYIKCIGEDRRLHIAEPHKSTTYCGVKVLKKKFTPEGFTRYFSCWDCSI